MRVFNRVSLGLFFEDQRWREARGSPIWDSGWVVEARGWDGVGGW